MHRDAAPPPVPVGASRREMHQSPRQRLCDLGAANGAPNRASPPGQSPQNALKLLQPADFSRSRQDKTQGGRKTTTKPGSLRVMQAQAVPGEPRIDARPSPKGSNNSSDWQSNGTADSNTSSVATDLSEDSRFSTRRLSAWDNHMRSMMAAQGEQAGLSQEEQALLAKMQKHFSVRADLGDWDASLKSDNSSKEPADGVGTSDPRFSVRSMDGWDRKIPLNVLAQKVLSNRFSIRSDADWDSSLGGTSDETTTTTRTGDYSTLDGDATTDGHTMDDAAIKAHFSLRSPEEWDSRVLAAYADRLSVRELDGWDAQVFKKLLTHRFSTRPDGDWDANIMPSAGTSSSSSSKGENDPRSRGQSMTIRRSRSNTVFSNRRLSAWDSGLVQKIPDISRKESSSQDASQDDGTRPRAGRRARSGSGFSHRQWNEWDACFDNSSDDISSGIGRSAGKNAIAADQPSRSSQWLKAAGGGPTPRHGSIFSMRDVDCWDAGLTAHLKEAIQKATTPTFDDGSKRLGHVTSSDGLGLSNVGA